MTNPATGAILYGVEVPKDGPRTYWANLRLSYEALPPDTRARIEGRRAIFSYAERYKDYSDETVPTEEILAKTPEGDPRPRPDPPGVRRQDPLPGSRAPWSALKEWMSRKVGPCSTN